jgi:hypothetical protein
MFLGTFIAVDYGDRYLITLLGRTVAGGWVIIFVAIVSSLTAGIATTLTKPCLGKSHPLIFDWAMEWAVRLSSVGRGLLKAPFELNFC